MRKYRITVNVEDASGFQCFTIEAENPSDAIRKLQLTGGEFEFEEVSIMRTNIDDITLSNVKDITDEVDSADTNPITGTLKPCGCGKPGRYLVSNGTACNKQMRCPTYDELNERLGNIIGLAYMMKRKLDAPDEDGYCLCCEILRIRDLNAINPCPNPHCLTHEITKMLPELPVVPK